jgi:hypothetical protein
MMSDTPWLLVGIAVLFLVVMLAVGRRVERDGRRRWTQQTARPGWWAPPEEQERLQVILARNPSYDEGTGLTSDPELARWLRDNQP